MSNEEDINFDVNGQTYILDFAEMQQVKIIFFYALCINDMYFSPMKKLVLVEPYGVQQ